MKIAIITNITVDRGFGMAERTARLLKDRAQVIMSDDCVLTDGCGITYMPSERLWDEAEIALVIGGDGTLLRAAPRCAKKNIPALGINMGKIGFLTEVEPDDIEHALNCIINGEYGTEKRMLLSMRINDENVSAHALNDIVISKPEGIKLIGIDLYTDNELVNHYVADGLILATPTGSTGYSISAGGPVVDPRMNLYVATPICAHMLAVRSAILPSNKDIVIKLSRDNGKCSAIISADGEKQRFVTSDDEIRITKSNYEFELIRIGASCFYKTLLSKLS